MIQRSNELYKSDYLEKYQDLFKEIKKEEVLTYVFSIIGHTKRIFSEHRVNLSNSSFSLDKFVKVNLMNVKTEELNKHYTDVSFKVIGIELKQNF